MVGLTDSFDAPKGCFRLVSLDQYDHSYFTHGDYETFEAAEAEAVKRARVPNGSPPSFSDIYYIHDDQGKRLKEISWSTLPEDQREDP